MKKKIDIIFNKFILNNNSILIEKNIQNESNKDNNELFFISISDLLNKEDNYFSHQINLIKQLIEKSIKEGNLEKYFMKKFQDSISILSSEEKEAKSEILYFTKYILEYILLLRSIDLNNNSQIENDELTKINNKDSFYFISFIGRMIKILKENNYLYCENNENNYNLSEIELNNKNKKIFEKMNNFYGNINKLINKIK